MSKNKIMYTIDGEAVLIHREIEGGYLGQFLYDVDFDEDDDFDPDDMICDTRIILHPQLFSEPPKIHIHKEIQELQNEKSNLNIELHELRVLKQEENITLGKIAKFPIIQQLVDFLNGDYAYLVYLKDLELIEKRQRYISSHVSTANIKSDGGFCLYLMSSENYTSRDDRAFTIFKTKEDADKFIIGKIIERLNSHQTNEYGGDPIEQLERVKREFYNHYNLFKLPEIEIVYNKKRQTISEDFEKKKEEKRQARLLELQAETDKLLNKDK